MKQTVHRILLPVLFVTIAGLVFKLMHWSGANVMLITGLGSLAVCNMAVAALGERLSEKVKRMAVAMFAVGFLFRLMHWPGSQSILIAALAGGITTMLLLLKEKRE